MQGDGRGGVRGWPMGGDGMIVPADRGDKIVRTICNFIAVYFAAELLDFIVVMGGRGGSVEVEQPIQGIGRAIAVGIIWQAVGDE